MIKPFFRPLSRALLPVVILAHAQSAGADASSLFISEYIEGSGFNKAIEIYNGTGGSIDLAADGYTLELYSNGSASPTQSMALTGSIADGDVFVIAHASADPAVQAVADELNSSVINFNGDDAIVLRRGGVLIDAFGQVGVDPGSQWIGGGQDDTLRRKADICAGDSIPDDAFDASIEWDMFAQNTFDGLGYHQANCLGMAAEPKINEFSASTTGTDVEYVEIYGAPNTDYSTYTVLEIEGDSTAAGIVDEVILLGTTDANGIYLASLPANALENGTLSLLLVNNFSGSLGEDLDTDNDGNLDVTPWDSVADAVSVNDGGVTDATYGVPVLGPNYDGSGSYAPGGASRIPDGQDSNTATDWVRNDFDLEGIPGYTGTIGVGEAYNTPGEPNQVFVQPPEACGDAYTAIFNVQGSGMASPLAGSVVSIEGIVTGDFQNNASIDNGDLNGFHVQDALGDGDPATSDGIFVYAPGGMDVSVGDAVRIRGAISEYNGMTEITASEIWVCSTGNSLAPTAISLPVSSVDDFEAFEGMLITLPQPLTISEYYNFDRYGEIVLSTNRQYTPTAVVDPGSAAIALAEEYRLNRITLDDGRSSQNPDPAIPPNGHVFDLDNLFRGGDSVTNVTGVLDYSFGLYRIQPTLGANHISANPRTDAPDDVGGDIRIASFNVLNYFTTIDEGQDDCGPSMDMECRGADTVDEFTRQRDKIISAISVIDADVVGLIEIENNGGVAVADLVSGLNDRMGADTYAAIDTGFIGTDAIAVGFIYKTSAVSPLGDFAILDASVDPRFVDTKNRPALAQTFMDNATGGVFTAVVNHLKSKGSDCNDLGDPDLGDGAGNCNLTRTLAAEALADWLETDPTGSGDDDFLIMGDLNSYDKEDPIRTLEDGGYTDLLDYFQGETAYSYVFDGQLGYLDYALSNESLTPQVNQVVAWHINADEPDLIDYDMSFKAAAQDLLYAPDAYRASDHDPVVIGLNVCDSIAPALDVSVTPEILWPANHKYVDVVATVTAVDNFDENPTISLVSVESNEPDNGKGDGNTVNDIVILDDFHFRLRAERSGSGKGRIYTITYRVTDACGNSTTRTASVKVPHSHGSR
ncbi:MAG: ExeM/NucH family extracellular endonuclease [Candidatus Thiodiazotropha sp.]